MILKAEIQAFSYLPLKSAYPQKFDGGTSEFRVVGFAQKARSQLGVEEASFLLFASLSSSLFLFLYSWMRFERGLGEPGQVQEPLRWFFADYS